MAPSSDDVPNSLIAHAAMTGGKPWDYPMHDRVSTYAKAMPKTAAPPPKASPTKHYMSFEDCFSEQGNRFHMPKAQPEGAEFMCTAIMNDRYWEMGSTPPGRPNYKLYSQDRVFDFMEVHG